MKKFIIITVRTVMDRSTKKSANKYSTLVCGYKFPTIFVQSFFYIYRHL